MKLAESIKLSIKILRHEAKKAARRAAFSDVCVFFIGLRIDDFLVSGKHCLSHEVGGLLAAG
ncbi:MAG: hypothetical protein K2L21_04130, partial [Muribaculaceae bacterium]|nr:hypothetical protein [Muribaculaceae bacterium]